jgi:hypothetical protein
MTRLFKFLPLVITVAAAIVLAANGMVLAQAQPQLVSAWRAGPLPLTDPLSPEWDTAPALVVPLIPQMGIAPSLPAVTVPSLNVQSLNDGQNIVFRLTWNDATPNRHATLTNEFRDAAALQFSASKDLPAVCMGAAGQPVNLWHWKADWQSDIDEGFRDVVDAYPNFWLDHYPFVVGEPPYRLPTDFNSPEAQAYLIGWTAGNLFSDPARVTPVEDLSALGFGAAESQARQDVLGRGVWEDGQWRVVFSRPLASADANDAQFAPGQTASAAFAVWDGADWQVGARKQLSTWTTLLVESAQPETPAPATLFGLPYPAAIAVLAALALLAAGGVVFVLRRRQPSA